MKKQQRQRYEMFVRVRNFGAANEALFPKSSPGGQRFAQVAALVAAMEADLQKRDLARAEAQRVNRTTRAMVRQHMKTIALTARRVVGKGPAIVFKMPSRYSTSALLTRARVFATEARRREAAFAAFDLSPETISEFEALVDQLEQAVARRTSSQSSRREAQKGIERSLMKGFTIIHDMDAVVANALRNDPVKFAGWEGARHLEGQGTTHHADGHEAPVVQPPAIPAVTTPAPDVPVPGETTVEDIGTVPIADDLRRAS